MKVAKYETSAGALATYLASRPQTTAMFDLYTIQFAGDINGGAPLTFTTADVDILVPYSPTPVTYSSQLIYFDQLNNKAVGHWKVGLDVDTWQVLVTPTAQAKIGNQPFLSAIRAGALDGAVVLVDRCFIDNRVGLPFKSVQSPLGVVNIFTGRIAEIDFGRTSAALSINSHLELLNVNIPRNLFQAGCRWTVYDAGCTLNRASFAVTGSIHLNSSSNALSVNLGTSPTGSATLALGYIEMTSGPNKGFTRLIRTYAPASPPPSAPCALTLIAPFPFQITAGETFTAYPGCDRQLSTCIEFNNETNFGGAGPFIPVPETAS